MKKRKHFESPEVRPKTIFTLANHDLNELLKSIAKERSGEAGDSLQITSSDALAARERLSRRLSEIVGDEETGQMFVYLLRHQSFPRGF